ncbi:hypothetical protein EDB92DRAFT_1230982 [Lactarius akahatsu]|uniref:Uncharacterized protein n=1 Tax=Lactarius akahatsu TaxID=416441 RepID=A0AAD4LAJ3_9AGAM|nr:hypothetical protein EDB92DRAFT_1230982 [Lactarius akahatsu]
MLHFGGALGTEGKSKVSNAQGPTPTVTRMPGGLSRLCISAFRPLILGRLDVDDSGSCSHKQGPHYTPLQWRGCQWGIADVRRIRFQRSATTATSHSRYSRYLRTVIRGDSAGDFHHFCSCVTTCDSACRLPSGISLYGTSSIAWKMQKHDVHPKRGIWENGREEDPRDVYTERCLVYNAQSTCKI